mmetsp:Transcript_15386/g.52185  ORF Transcript_15386/g.52185 Transcript_15386/m.52185 type:complete len:188 (-) Transcript_15386:773-1336(-)
MDKRNGIVREQIQGSRTLSNYIVVLILSLAGISFFLVGLSSYLNMNLFPLTDTSQLSFLPQGITMLFYGFLAILISIFLIINIALDVGSGYNEFSKEDELVRVVRRSLSSKQELVFLTYPLNSIKKIKVEFKQGLNPRNNILLILKDQREIPLYPAQKYISIAEIEQKAIELSEFLSLPLENNFTSI